ncbi:heavy-metal-associated domain-containing protein [Tistrella mobilis]|uniref:heavy-metal-associated domain-containing protein n=1 Tax=Tistrella mobilis TaxID=171437 RepID=UPI0031F65BF9
MTTQTYRVEGMTCDGCAKAVRRALGARLPEAGIEIDRPAGLVTIAGAHDEAVVREAIDDAGYDFGGKAA